MTNYVINTKDYMDILCRCAIFSELPADHLVKVLACLQAHSRRYRKEEIITLAGETSHTAGIVLSGSVGISFPDENGNLVRIRNLSPSDLFGAEQACGSYADGMITLQAITDCEILLLDFTSLLSSCDNHCEYRTQVTVNLLRELAAQTHFLNGKIRIISQKRLRDRLRVYLQSLPVHKNGMVRIPFTRQELAEYLYADRSALSRELSRMRDEGLINYKGSTVWILDSTFL